MPTISWRLATGTTSAFFASTRGADPTRRATVTKQASTRADNNDTDGRRWEMRDERVTLQLRRCGEVETKTAAIRCWDDHGVRHSQPQPRRYRDAQPTPSPAV